MLRVAVGVRGRVEFGPHRSWEDLPLVVIDAADEKQWSGACAAILL